MQRDFYWGILFLWNNLHIFLEINDHNFIFYRFIIDCVTENIWVIFVPFVFYFLSSFDCGFKKVAHLEVALLNSES